MYLLYMSNCLHYINARNLSIHAARMQLYIYLDTNLFYCESDYNWRTPPKKYTLMFLLFIRSVNIISSVHVCLNKKYIYIAQTVLPSA